MLYPFSRLLFQRGTCPVKTLMEFRAGATANGTSAQEVALSKKNRHHAGDQEPAKLFVDKTCIAMMSAKAPHTTVCSAMVA